jgi:hypothetical protein
MKVERNLIEDLLKILWSGAWRMLIALAIITGIVVFGLYFPRILIGIGMVIVFLFVSLIVGALIEENKE